jgi:hypothetical protein
MCYTVCQKEELNTKKLLWLFVCGYAFSIVVMICLICSIPENNQLKRGTNKRKFKRTDEKREEKLTERKAPTFILNKRSSQKKVQKKVQFSASFFSNHKTFRSATLSSTVTVVMLSYY